MLFALMMAGSGKFAGISGWMDGALGFTSSARER